MGGKSSASAADAASNNLGGTELDYEPVAFLSHHGLLTRKFKLAGGPALPDWDHP
jgi:hypothetical protein